MVLGALGAMVSTGCASGQLLVTSLRFDAIDPPSADVGRIDLQEAYWWEDDEGSLWVAARRPYRGWTGRNAGAVELSLRLAAPPRGRARNYTMSRETLRLRGEFGPLDVRFESKRGIAALYRLAGDRYRCRFRALTTRETRQVVGGWGRPTRHLVMGECVAVHDPRRGQKIATATESLGWERKDRPSPAAGDSPDAVDRDSGKRP